MFPTSYDDHQQHRPFRRALKPLIDRLGAALLLLLAAPWLLLIALALWLTDDGPLLARERRIGRDNRPFWLLRFRTTGWGAPHLSTEVGSVRRLLRRSHLDELPQLFNVVRGDLSLVGPRPSRSGNRVDDCPTSLKPGLIGLSDPRGVPIDQDPLTPQRYAEEWSLRLDLAILWRALRHALRTPA
jgi:lipopolysaccharide/colanic/teichoic acid biosynthesis glycosyltransferase